MLVAALLVAAAAAAPACDAERATPVTVSQMARAPERWLGRCVRVSGIVSGNIFYDDVEGVYRAEATDADTRANEGWLGLYASPPEPERRGPFRASVAGIVHDCTLDYEKAVADSNPDDLIMPTGYCHYRGGLVLVDARVRYDRPIRLSRQSSDAARRRFGDLLTVREAGPVPEPAKRLVDQFVAAFEAQDRAGLAALVSAYDGQEPAGPGLDRWQSFLAGDTGPFRSLRAHRRIAEPVFFRERLSAADEIDPPVDPHWFACFCTASGCADRWPISSVDTQAELSRPYLCLRAYRDTTAERSWSLGVGLKPSGRDEPT
jgi:hypothetical protein